SDSDSDSDSDADSDTDAPNLSDVSISGNSTDGYEISFISNEEIAELNLINNRTGEPVDIQDISYNPATGEYVISIAGNAVEIGDVLTIEAADEAGNVNDENEVTIPEDLKGGKGEKEDIDITPVPGKGTGSGGSGTGTTGTESSQDKQKLPDTATSAWTIGLVGLATLAVGAGVTLFSRRKKAGQ
ncbi:LPXTG cell wall anchor domain-containing protein, partial [Oceanobacillus sp. CFH 90083]|uniref:LPXTG cell wall anchor domain-containing protein n=1 Tax=Oceanobacillus sp. CFH 90083 TaxID=2592336 RepID=UPI00128DB00C